MRMKKGKRTATKRLFLLVDKIFYKTQNPPKETAEALSRLTVERDLSFSEDFPDMKLDLLYAPRPEGEKYPVIFHIHGGGFSAGDKRYRDYLCATLALETGACVVNINHPLGPEVVWPLPLRCLVQGANWVKDHAEEHAFDVERVAVVGDSSGAYYAAMLCAVQNNPSCRELYGDLRLTIDAAAFSSGLFDLRDSLEHPLPFGITRGVCMDITGMKVKETLQWDNLDNASPTRLITSGHPDCFVVYAEKDFFAKGQAERFIEGVREAGGKVEEVHSTKFIDNHAFMLNRRSKIALEAKEKLFDFLRRAFGEKQRGEE